MLRYSVCANAAKQIFKVQTVRPLLGSIRIQFGNLPIRFQSTTYSKVEANTDSPLSDRQIDDWLKAIDELKDDFSQSEYMPEHALAPPGQSKIDIVQEANIMAKKFLPSAEQTAEWDTLKEIPMPQRKDPILEHVTNMIMRHGKKQLAERKLSRALYIVYCKTRKDPIEILKKSLDDLAPLMVVKTFNTGVAKSAIIPVPLNQRQRNRLAWKWITESANKRISSDFSVRLGEELISVNNGSSAGFEKRDQLHKTAIAHRSYIKLK